MTKEQLLKRKKAVLAKFYGGERRPYMHNFGLADGKCWNCGTFIEEEIDKKTRKIKDFGQMCKVITPEEVSNFVIDPKE